MSRLLNEVIARLETLAEEEQNVVAAYILSKIDLKKQWDRLFPK